MLGVRRSQTLRSARSSMPAAHVIPSKATTLDDLGVLREERSAVVPSSIQAIEVQLRAEILEKERANDKLQDQIVGLQTQLAQRPPLSTIQELENERKALELMFQGTQRENEKLMNQLQRAHDRTRMLENELRKLCGENWQTSLNIPPAEAHSFRSGVGMASYVANPRLSSSSLSLVASRQLPPKSSRHRRSQSAVVASSLLNNASGSGGEKLSGIKDDPNSSYSTAVDQTRATRGDSGSEDDVDEVGDDSAEVEDVLQGGDCDDVPTERERALERQNEALRQQLEQVKLLVLGLDKRLNEREESLTKAIERAEQENRSLDVKLRELDLNVT